MFTTEALPWLIISHLATGIFGAVISQVWTALLLRGAIKANGKWPEVASQAIAQAPAIIEGAGRLSVGLQEILQLVIRAGGITRLVRAATSAEKPSAAKSTASKAKDD